MVIISISGQLKGIAVILATLFSYASFHIYAQTQYKCIQNAVCEV
jgi:hypothetical protein